MSDHMIIHNQILSFFGLMNALSIAFVQMMIEMISLNLIFDFSPHF